MKRLFGAAALACTLAFAGCVPRLDARVAEVSDRLAARCIELQGAGLAIDLLAPERVRTAAAEARAVFDRFCAQPPRSSAEALVAVADVLRARQALEAAKRGA